MFNETILKIAEFIKKYGMYTIWCIIALLLYTLVVGNIYYAKGWDNALSEQKTDTITNTITEVVFDTIQIDRPVAKYITHTKTITDTLRDTLNNVIYATIPIESKVYADTNYYAVVSGYKANLDTIRTYNKVITNNTTTTITKTSVKKPVVSITPSVGYGYGLKNKHFEPFVGVTVGVPIFNFYKTK